MDLRGIDLHAITQLACTLDEAEWSLLRIELLESKARWDTALEKARKEREVMAKLAKRAKEKRSPGTGQRIKAPSADTLLAGLSLDELAALISKKAREEAGK